MVPPFIQNVALADIEKGFHYDAGINSVLIQIVDPAMEFPTPKHNFRKVFQFEFLDIESDGLTNMGDGSMIDMSPFAITDQDAEDLVTILKEALDNNSNVIVHCVAGVCRSGAVTEVGIMMGFRDTETYRSPNLLVKHKMMKKLGWTYDENELPSINGVPINYEKM